MAQRIERVALDTEKPCYVSMHLPALVCSSESSLMNDLFSTPTQPFSIPGATASAKVPPSVSAPSEKFAIIDIGGAQQVVEEGRWYTCNRLQVCTPYRVQLCFLLTMPMLKLWSRKSFFLRVQDASLKTTRFCTHNTHTIYAPPPSSSHSRLPRLRLAPPSSSVACLR